MNVKINFKFFLFIALLNYSNFIATSMAAPDPLRVPLRYFTPYSMKTSLLYLLDILLKPQSTQQKLKEIDILQEHIRINLKSLKERDGNGLCIIDSDISKIKELWNNLKSLYSYHWLDQVMYCCNPFVGAELDNNCLYKFARKRKDIVRLLHSDKYTRQNQAKVDEIFKEINDISRPELPLDTLGFGSFSLLTSALSMSPVYLINKMFPNFFKHRKEILSLNALGKKYSSAKKSLEINKSILALKGEEMKIMKLLSKN